MDFWWVDELDISRSLHCSCPSRHVPSFTVHPFNPWVPGRAGCYFRNAFFELYFSYWYLQIVIDNVFSWMQWRLTDDKSALVQVMGWCHQATNHYLNRCWPRSMSSNGVTRPQWVNKWFKTSNWNIAKILRSELGFQWPNQTKHLHISWIFTCRTQMCKVVS